MEHQNYATEMQLEMIHEIETTHPKYAVYIDNSVSWLADQNSNMMIKEWAKTYLTKYYQIVGIIDHTVNGYFAFWENDLSQYNKKSNSHIYVLERIN